MPTITDLATDAQAIAHKLGVEKFDIYGTSIDETSVQVDQGEPKQVKASNRSSVIVRVWNRDHRMGVTSTTDTNPLGMELALRTAQEASSFGVREHAPDFSPEATVAIAVKPEKTGSQAAVPQLIEHLVAAEKELLAAHPAIKGVPYNGLAQREIDRFYLNSDGATRRETRSYSSIYLYSKTEEPGRRPRSAGAYRVSRTLDQLDIDGCKQEAAEKTISHLDYQSIKSGQYRVVFSPEAFLSLLSAFSNLFNGQNVLDKQSLATPELLGTQIASSLLSIYDDALHPASVAAETFDGEGTPTRRVPLMTKGILTSFLHSAGTAKRLNARPTGHANIGAKVTVGAHFYHVFPGVAIKQSYSLAAAEDTILIDDLKALHAGVKALQGSFSLPFDGWLVKQGRLISIESATVAGDFLELLKSIIFVEPEAEVTPAGVCPRIWVDRLSITGE